MQWNFRFLPIGRSDYWQRAFLPPCDTGAQDTFYIESMQKMIHFIRADRDPEAGVWVATSNDVPGLATEADTLEDLSDKLRQLVPELLQANGEAGVDDDDDIAFELLARRFAVAQRIAH